MAVTRYESSGTDIGADWLAPGAIPSATSYQKSGVDINSLGRSCADDGTCGGGKTCDSTSSRYKELGSDIGPRFMTSCTSGGVGVGGVGVGVILP